MHISLDSELGQQRRLNQIGETITSIAAPTAAYSLRSLTGGDPLAVRVRRESDDTERDFTVSEVNSGAMVDFVNTQTVKPLDVRARNTGTGERDGFFQIAKAAYSLRSLGDRQATVSATGDTVAADNGKYVVQVRRSSDDTIKSFTADEVTDGTLVDFVNNRVNGIFANTGYESFSNASVSGFTASNTDGTGFAVADIPNGGSGDVVTASFDISITNGSPKLSLRSSLTGSGTVSNVEEYTSSGSYIATLEANSGYIGIGFTEGDSPSNFTVSNFKILGNGFVSKWYDQSVTTHAGDTATGNHILQSVASKQPKIVISGSLLSAGITFDGTDDELATASGAVITESNSGTFSAFSVQTIATGEAGYMYGNASQSPDKGSSFYARSEPDFVLSDRISVQSEDRISRSAGQNLLSCVYKSSRANFLVNGSGTTTTEGSYDFDAGSLLFVVGNRNGGTSAATFLSGSFQEIIIYNDDQTDNRGAFEGNMADHYNISGVPTEDNTVNGFVSKWYDQSGNNRDLIQATMGEQPFIVESGVFQNGVKGNKATSNDNMQNLQVSTDGSTPNFGTDDWASGASSKLGIIYVGTVPGGSVANNTNPALIWGGGNAASTYQAGGVSLQVIKAGTDSWRIVNERQGDARNQTALSKNLDDLNALWYGIIDNRDFTVNVNGTEATATQSEDVDVAEDAPLSLFGAYGGDGASNYQRSGGGICKECYLYAGTSITDIPTIATKINEQLSIYS